MGARIGNRPRLVVSADEARVRLGISAKQVPTRFLERVHGAQPLGVRFAERQVLSQAIPPGELFTEIIHIVFAIRGVQRRHEQNPSPWKHDRIVTRCGLPPKLRV